MSEPGEFARHRDRLKEEISQVTAGSFDRLALDVFRFQAAYNRIYADYLTHLRCDPEQVTALHEIPFLPVSFFKSHKIVTGPDAIAARVFESSGTTGSETSRHYVSDTDLYERLSVRIFERSYGPLPGFHILALLPSYLERNNSSLVYMVQHFMKLSGSPFSGFYLDDFEALNRKLAGIRQADDGRKILLIGVTFALLDWADYFEKSAPAGEGLPDITVMETGGMKGRRREMLRREVHDLLGQKLGIGAVHSEYGMTEMVSQAYARKEGVFRYSDSMKVLIRDITDPFSIRTDGQTGGINIVDLGNLGSCSFIETSDIGRADAGSGTFEILGRLDNSDIRGCNLLYI